MKNKKLQAGYTLIELLAVMIILVAVGTIITSILVSTLRSGDKSTTTNDVRQSGNYAISQMSKMIAYAKSFGGVSQDYGSTFANNCVAPVVGQGVPTPIPPSYNAVAINSFDGGQVIFNCSADGKLASNGANLIPDTMTASACSFTCSQNSTSTSPTININLTLQKNHPVGFTLLPEAQTVIKFQTSVTLRNNGL
jgi:prepilin-type N-terminal cleavage/methylation domain-containing protein